jgi:hypothetical protein
VPQLARRLDGLELRTLVWIGVGFGLYGFNMVVGLAAQFGWRFGIWHHVLYFVVFLSTGLAFLVSREPSLVLTLACLALFPKAKPRTWLHPTLAFMGAAGYLLSYVI